MMANGNYFDFDAYMEERKGNPFIVKAFGKEYEISNDIPFDVVLRVARSARDGEQTLGEEATLEIGEKIFGKENFEELLKKGLGVTGLIALTEKVLEMYMSKATKEATETAETKAAQIKP